MTSLFSIPFRPFFLICALIASINPVLWMLTYSGEIEIQTVFQTPQYWHGFEMLFGFTQALMTGFLLTASANWTKKRAFNGNKLIFLTAIFLIERIIPFLSIGKMNSFILLNLSQLLFLSYLIYMLIGNRNQFIMTPIVFLLSLSKVLYSYGAIFDWEKGIELGRHYGTISFVFLIVIFTGRILPMFSRRHLGFKPEVPKWVDKGSILFLSFLLIPSINMNRYLEAVILISLSVFLILRLKFWGAKKVFKFPLLGVLHTGQFFLCLALILRAASLFFQELDTAFTPLHGLTIGTLGIFGIGMMVRVSKGHTGREMKSDFWDKLIFHGMYICAVFRILPIVTLENYYIELFFVATVFWTVCFLLFLIKYSGILFLPRIDENLR